MNTAGYLRWAAAPVKRSARPLLVSAMALWLFAGCTIGDVPAPVPEATTDAVPRTADRSGQPVTEAPDAGSGPLADVDPCGLVSADAASTLDLSGGTAKKVGAARVCRWRHEGTTLRGSFSVGVEIFDEHGLADLDGPRDSSTIGTHPAATVRDVTGGCRVGLGVGTSARVDVTAVGGEAELGCRLATRLAHLVEPRLR
ncbi:DUF3558 family protein [Micromonospora sp. WMMD1102]|uniref:DUF3558 family protein n=1 Tax=Micromonospora sp. WMMD1102 TaxID=3016105 RepID=UPI0024155CE2|nr:DUF3558 family protein [Micromonospora sp. WMMD1102]MDG4788981.1 DUF3558 family protein [Micromonospora sp. WMMD1102]